MSQTAIYLLLFLALVLPVPGVILARLLGRRFGEGVVVFGAALCFLVAIGSAVALARADISTMRVGDLTLFLPATRRSEGVVLQPDVAPAGDPETAPEGAPPAIPTLTPRPSATPEPTDTPEPTETPEPTATPVATATPEATATATPEPPTATPEPAAGPRRYTVQPGDTFRAIAERFGVTVAELLEANDFTPAQADSLRPGQELIIP